MARVPDIGPDFGNLGNPPVPVSERPIVSTDLSAPSRAIAQAGAQGFDTAEHVYDEQGKIDTEFAKSNYLTALQNTQREEENNPDWKGSDARWKEASKTAFEQSAEKISNPRYRNQFTADASMITAQHYDNFQRQVDNKRKQDGLGKVTQAVQNNMSNALSAQDDATVGEVINNTNNILKSATATGLITPVQEIEQRNKWIKDYGQGKIDQYLAAGDPEGAKDWFNKHHNLLNPTPDDAAKMNTAVTLPRAQGVTDRIVNGQTIANVTALDAAQIDKESSNGKNLVSEKGALGIMQLLPSTAMGVASKLGMPYDPDRLKNDPIYNATLGREYRNEMLTRYHGNQTLAMAAYNAGPRNVDKWVKQFGNPNIGEISEKDFIDKIPFPETKDYVEFINKKAPPLPGVPLDAQNPEKSHEAWMEAANTMPESVRPLVTSSIQARIADGQQQKIDTQTTAASTMISPILSGDITDPSQLQAPEMQQAWTNANPELQKAVLGGMKEVNKEKNEYGPKFWDLYKAVHAPDGDGSKITDPTEFYKYGDGNGLTLGGINKLTEEINTKKTAQGAQKAAMETQTFKVIKTQLSGEDMFPGMKDPKGEEIFAQAMPMVYQAIEDGQKKGIPASQLYDPKSKDWVGNVIKPLIRSPDQWHSDILGASIEEPPKEETFWDKMSKPSDNIFESMIERNFKEGQYTGSTDKKAEGLQVLRDNYAQKRISPEKFKQLAVAYGYARGEK